MNVSAVEILLFIAGYSEKLKGGICNDSLIIEHGSISFHGSRLTDPVG